MRNKGEEVEKTKEKEKLWLYLGKKISYFGEIYTPGMFCWRFVVYFLLVGSEAVGGGGIPFLSSSSR